MSNLLVISQVYINKSECKINNLSFAKIINKYTDYWEEVYVLGPSINKESFLIKSASNDKLHLIGVGNYNGNITSRFYHILFGGKNIINFLTKNINLEKIDLIQIRYPSMFTYIICKKLVKFRNIGFYLAGDGVEAVKYNYPILVPLAKFVELLEIRTLINKKVVTTGPQLAMKYSKYSLTHPYMSTTHSTVLKKTPKQLKRNIIYVGTLERRKRVKDLIKAISLLKIKYPDIVCKIVGDGPTKTNLKKLCNKLNIDDNILFTGYISDDTILEKLYIESDILVLPSLAEGTPRVLPEAMSKGVIPIAVKNISSNNFIITENINGLLVTGKSPNEIATKIERVIENTDLYHHLLSGIYEYALKHTINNELDKMWSFYTNNKLF